MVTIKEQSRDFNNVEKYLMTSNPNITSMKNVEDGTSIPVAGWLTYEDTKKDGKVEHIMSIITPANEVYAFQSDTFIESLMDIDSVMDGGAYSIIKTSGTTKAGRPYINCYLDVNSVITN